MVRMILIKYEWKVLVFIRIIRINSYISIDTYG